MINAILINSTASLNDFFQISGISYVPGTNLTVNFRLMQSERDLRYIEPNVNAVITVKALDIDGNEVVKTATFIDQLDRSLLSISFTQEETEELNGGNLVVTLDVAGDQSELYITVIQGALSKTTITGGGCC